MPIKHFDSGGTVDTSDIYVAGGPQIDKVFESGNGDPIIWQRSAGYWGVVYNQLTAPFSPLTPPTAAQILALTGINEITGSKRDMAVSFVLNEVDWRAATGHTGAFPFSASGRAFFITKNWGAPLGMTSSGFDVHEAFNSFSVTLNGVTYTGVFANGAPPQYDGTAYQFRVV
jgi:hypothetical protein